MKNPLRTVLETRLRKRIQKLPSADLFEWADQVITDAWRMTEAFRKTAEQPSLDEARKNWKTCGMILDELQERLDAANRPF